MQPPLAHAQAAAEEPSAAAAALTCAGQLPRSPPQPRLLHAQERSLPRKQPPLTHVRPRARAVVEAVWQPLARENITRRVARVLRRVLRRREPVEVAAGGPLAADAFCKVHAEVGGARGAAARAAGVEARAAAVL